MDILYTFGDSKHIYSMYKHNIPSTYFSNTDGVNSICNGQSTVYVRLKEFHPDSTGCWLLLLLVESVVDSEINTEFSWFSTVDSTFCNFLYFNYEQNVVKNSQYLLSCLRCKHVNSMMLDMYCIFLQFIHLSLYEATN